MDTTSTSEPWTRSLARQLTLAGLPPAAAAAWMHCEQEALEGRTPAEVIEESGDVLDAFALVIGVASTLRDRPCRKRSRLEEDGRCECGEYHLGEL